jgi:hypothetical protein
MDFYKWIPVIFNGEESDYIIFINDSTVIINRKYKINNKLNNGVRADHHLKERELKQSKAHTTGYTQVGFTHKGKTYRLLVHRIVALTFIPNPENKKCVNHIDGNKSNNHPSNLEWCTYKENIKHAHDTGLIIKGKGVAKLTHDQVVEIRLSDIVDKRHKYKLFSNKFNVSRTTIGDVIRRKTFKYL